MRRVLIFLKKQKLAVVLLAVFGMVAFVDLANIDRYIYKGICSLLGLVFPARCPDFYDLPFWDVWASFGTLAAVYFAYLAIQQSNRQLEIEQTPYVVMKDRVGAAGESNKLHIVMLKNIGKGMAVNLTATADPDGRISMIDGTNPHSIDLGSGEPNNGWAIDEGKVIEGLRVQGKKIESSVNKEIPDETSLDEDHKLDSEFYFYFWYSDQIGNRYLTETKMRHAGSFFKVMGNRVSRLNEMFST